MRDSVASGGLGVVFVRLLCRLGLLFGLVGSLCRFVCWLFCGFVCRFVFVLACRFVCRFAL